MLEGIDTSNLQGTPSNYAGQWWYQQAQFVIVQAIPKGALTAPQLYQAEGAGKYCGIYTWLWHTPSWRLGDQTVEGDQLARLATVPDNAKLDMRPWLDVEDNISDGWAAPGNSGRKDDVLRAFDALDTWAAGRGLPEAGIYTSQYFIDLLFGGDESFLDGRKRWLANYSASAGGVIGGNVVAHQYTSDPVDRDVMLESEIVSGPSAADVLQALSYIDHDVLAPLRSYKTGKVKAAVAEIDRVARQYGAA